MKKSAVAAVTQSATTANAMRHGTATALAIAKDGVPVTRGHSRHTPAAVRHSKNLFYRRQPCANLSTTQCFLDSDNNDRIECASNAEQSQHTQPRSLEERVQRPSRGFVSVCWPSSSSQVLLLGNISLVSSLSTSFQRSFVARCFCVLFLASRVARMCSDKPISARCHTSSLPFWECDTHARMMGSSHTKNRMRSVQGVSCVGLVGLRSVCDAADARTPIWRRR